MRRPNQTQLNQKGFASIVIALILIIVLALITVGFAQLARREQKNALDKQLSNQATYAAESGINDALQDIKSGAICDSTITPSCAVTTASSNKCMTGVSSTNANTTRSLPLSALTAKPDINSNSGTTYTCVLVQLKTTNLQFNNVSPSTGRHITITTDSTLGTMTVSWGSADGHDHFPASAASTKLPPQSQWHDAAGNPYPPVVAFSIAPTSNLDSQWLIDHTFNVYLYPSSAASAAVPVVTNASGQVINQGQLVDGNCNSSNNPPCHVTISGLNAQNYVVYFTDYYDQSNMLVTGTSSVTGTTVNFTGEPIIDITGKAREVLKRVRVRVLTNGTTTTTPGSPPTANDNAPLPTGTALQAQNICKRIQADPITYDNPNGSAYEGLSSACNLSN